MKTLLFIEFGTGIIKVTYTGGDSMDKRNDKGQFIKGQNIVDKTGERYGRLKVISMSDKRSGRKTFWNCICDCGNEKVVRSDSLGSIQSCGCLKKEQDRKNLTKNHRHKQSGKRIYNTWMGMKMRCTNKNSDSYKRYGALGIKVCDEWMNSFDVFYEWAMNNGYDDNLTIERMDYLGNYTPENCTWIPHNEQAINRRSTVWIEWNGEKHYLKKWSELLGINYGTLSSRYNRSGMRPPELFEPVKTTPR